MKHYRSTSKPFEGNLTSAKGMVYTVIKFFGERGTTREVLNDKIDGILSPSTAYARLCDLVHDGFVVVESTGATPQPDVIVLTSYKWRCPTCRQWIREDIAMRCAACRGNWLNKTVNLTS